jgi:hypothetical protein
MPFDSVVPTCGGSRAIMTTRCGKQKVRLRPTGGSWPQIPLGYTEVPRQIMQLSRHGG